jgi:hypothetical protein
MLSKESKIRVLENFYALDYIFFGKPVAHYENCCPIMKEDYLSVKGALMSVFVEMLRLVNHQPKTITEHVDSKMLNRFAIKSAKIARENCQKIVQSPKARADIKMEIKEALNENSKLDPDKLVQEKIREKAFRLAVDNLLVAKTLTESRKIKALDEWEGRIIEDSYKLLRDGLCESAMLILDNA